MDERYATIVKDMQQVARTNLIFGLHVHVGIPDREEGIDIMNQARYFLPHLYALSVNSPFWLGQNTGLKAYRQMIFERFPRTGIPDAFESLSEYDDYLKLLVSTNCIDNAKTLLLDRNRRISEIAYDVGFQSLTHFNRIFKKLVGASPSSYRRSVSKLA